MYNMCVYIFLIYNVCNIPLQYVHLHIFKCRSSTWTSFTCFQLENNEDYLRDSLGEANQEREDLLERISLLQAKIKSQNEEIRSGRCFSEWKSVKMRFKNFLLYICGFFHMEFLHLWHEHGHTSFIIHRYYHPLFYHSGASL